MIKTCHKKKTKCVSAWGLTQLIENPPTPYLVPNSWNIDPHTTQSFDFLIPSCIQP